MLELEEENNNRNKVPRGDLGELEECPSVLGMRTSRTVWTISVQEILWQKGG